MVLPPIVPLPTIEVSPGGRTGEGHPRPNALERTVSAASVREHVHGDSVRWIHWPTSARRDELFVRLFDGTPASDRWILLDMELSVQAGEGQDATEEHGIILTASLADQGLRSGWAVGLAAHGERLVWLPPREGEAQRWEILRTLALVSLGARPLVELLARVGPALGHSASLVVITPSSDSAWIGALVPLLRRGAIPTVLLLDPVSFDGTGDQSAVRASLTDLGVAHYVITRDLLDRPETRAEQCETWEKMLAGTGRSVSFRQRPGASWRVLS
jgi:uncharacterized protein (DUF58 family)